MMDIEGVQNTFSVGVRFRVKDREMNDVVEVECRDRLGKEFGVESQGDFVHMQYGEGRGLLSSPPVHWVKVTVRRKIIFIDRATGQWFKW